MTQITSTTVPQEQQKPVLLPTYPQHLIEALTPRQLRATLAGQTYYQTHQHGTHATHAQFCAFLKKKIQGWKYTGTSTEWQNYFISGWHAALLDDPTAEKERPAVTQEQPAQAGQHNGDGLARLLCDKDEEDEDYRPCGADEKDIEEDYRPHLTISNTVTAGSMLCDPEDTDDEVGCKGDPIAPAKAGEPTRPAFGADDAEVKARLSCCDERDIEEDYHPRPSGADEKDIDEDYRPRLTFGGTATARMLCDPESAADEEEGPVTAGPEGDDEPGERRPSIHHDEIEYRRTRRRLTPRPTHLTFIPEDPTTDSLLFGPTGGDDETWRCPLLSFGDDDDEQEEHGGWLRSRLPRYLAAQKGGDGAYLLTTASGYPLPIPLMGGDGYHFDDEKPDDDGWHHPRPHYSFTKARGTTQRPLLFGDDDEKDDEWGRSAHPHAFLAGKLTAALLA